MRKWLVAGLLTVAVWFAGDRSVSAADPGGVLRWGADAGGGAPYVYKDDNGKIVGFEVDLADELARRLGLRAEFVQEDWETLPQALLRGDIDIILNGYEWTADREQVLGSTIPYYTAGVQLLVRKDRAAGPDAIAGWADLHRRNADGSKKVVAVLANSASERYVKSQFGGDVEIAALKDEGTTGAMDQVVKGRYDATVQDELTAGYYLATDEFKDKLQVVGPKAMPRDEGYYVIYTRKPDGDLRERLNGALRDLMADGTLRAIYEKNGIWNGDQERLPEVAKNWPPSVSARSTPWGQHLLFLLQSAGVTVLLSFLAFPLAVAAGLLVALGRLYGPRWLAALLTAYVELLRGTPVLLQL